MSTLDRIDARILELLRANADMPNRSIAKAVGLSEAGTRKRIARLKESGVIRRFTIELGGREEVRALVFISIDSAALTPFVAKAVRGVEGVNEVYEVAGDFDIAVLISASDVPALNGVVDGIRKVKHVQNTDTRMILRSWD